MDIPAWLASSDHAKFAKVELESCGVTRTLWRTYSTDTIASTIRAFAMHIGQHRSSERQFSMTLVAKPEEPNTKNKRFDEEAWRRGLLFGDVVELVSASEPMMTATGTIEVVYLFQLVGREDPNEENLPQ